MEEIYQIVIQNEQSMKHICSVIIENQLVSCAQLILEKNGNLVEEKAPCLYKQLLVIANDFITIQSLSFKSKELMKCLILAQKIKNNEVIQILISKELCRT